MRTALKQLCVVLVIIICEKLLRPLFVFFVFFFSSNFKTIFSIINIKKENLNKQFDLVIQHNVKKNISKGLKHMIYCSKRTYKAKICHYCFTVFPTCISCFHSSHSAQPCKAVYCITSVYMAVTSSSSFSSSSSSLLHLNITLQRFHISSKNHINSILNAFSLNTGRLRHISNLRHICLDQCKFLNPGSCFHLFNIGTSYFHQAPFVGAFKGRGLVRTMFIELEQPMLPVLDRQADIATKKNSATSCQESTNATSCH